MANVVSKDGTHRGGTKKPQQFGARGRPLKGPNPLHPTWGGNRRNTSRLGSKDIAWPIRPSSSDVSTLNSSADAIPSGAAWVGDLLPDAKMALAALVAFDDPRAVATRLRAALAIGSWVIGKPNVAPQQMTRRTWSISYEGEDGVIVTESREIAVLSGQDRDLGNQ